MPAFETVYPFFGLAGSAVILAGMGIAAIFYRGRQGERYSPLNHFISELGEVGVSRVAVAFNGGLILGGGLLLPFIVGLGLALPAPWGYLAMAAGIWAAVSSMLVGIFPMNNLTPHVRVAMSYFRSGLATMLLFSLAIFLQAGGQAAVPLAAGAYGLAGAAVYAAFLLGMGKPVEGSSPTSILDPAVTPVRPVFWRIAALEWAVFGATVAWFLLVGISIL